MTTQYLRKFSAIIANDTGGGLDFADFRCTFQIRRGDLQTPNSCDLRIYNLSDSTANQITSPEFTQIAIQGGYDGNYGLLFTGNIKQARKGRDDAKDSYVDVTAADGDEAYNFATLSLSLAAGAKPADAVQAFLKGMATSGITQGYEPVLSSNGSIRGQVFHGMVKDELRKFAESNDVLWSIQDGKLTLIPQTSYVPGDIPLITPATGLIGVPEQTANGIRMKVLLNPAIRVGQCVKLDSTINLFRYGLGLGAQVDNGKAALENKTNADGQYYVMSADHTGDTRGNNWYTTLTCLSVDVTVLASQAPKGAIQPDASSIRRD